MTNRPLTTRTDLPRVFWSTRYLLSHGATERELCLAVREGRLLRARRGRYLPVGAHSQVVAAVAAGGRLDCVSLLALLGVFVFSADEHHVAVPQRASRLPPPPPRMVRHWRDDDRDDGDRAISSLVPALIQAVRCQSPRHAVATIDSALHLGLVRIDELDDVFDGLSRRFRVLRRLVDARAESGPETLMRLMLRTLGADVAVQVSIDGVGRVDFVVDGWLIVECDSRAHHAEWSDHVRDRRRDLAAAGLGYTTVRLLAEDILYRPAFVLTALRRTLAAQGTRPAVGNSGDRRRRKARTA